MDRLSKEGEGTIMLGRNKGIICIAVISSLFLAGISEAEDFCQLTEADRDYWTEQKFTGSEVADLERQLKAAKARGNEALVDQLEESLATAKLKYEAAVRRQQEVASLRAALKQAPDWLSQSDKEKIICASGHQPDWDPDQPQSSRAPRKTTLAVLEEVMGKHPKAPAGFSVREFLSGVKRSPLKGRACQAFQIVASGILVVWDFVDAKADTPGGSEVSCPIPDDGGPSQEPPGGPTGGANSTDAEPQTCKPIVCPAAEPTPSASPSPRPTGTAPRGMR